MSAGHIAFLGLGEAGSLIASDLADAGVRVRGYDPRVFESRGVEVAATAADAARGARVVVSVNSAADAVEAAASVADVIHEGQLYADFNTAAPERKREVASVLAPTGALFADVALMQSVPGRGIRTPALASGPGARPLADVLGPAGMPMTVGSDEPGYAAARKLVRSVFVKGLAAAAGEALAAGERLGCETWLYDDIGRTLEGADRAMLDHLVAGSRRHAVRRTAEMDAAVSMLEDLDVEPRIAAATRAWLHDLAEQAAQRALD